MKFAQLDPRTNNESILAEPCLGIEVTVPSLAARCSLGNIDPQHTGVDRSKAAIEAALDHGDPYETIRVSTGEEITLVTVRPDLDSVGAMAVLYLFSTGHKVYPLTRNPNFAARLGAVALADKFARGSWPGEQPMPSAQNPWPSTAASASDTRDLAAIAAAIADHRVALDVRVQWMAGWLLEGVEPLGYREKAEAERMKMIEALDSGQIRYACKTKKQEGIQATYQNLYNDSDLLVQMRGPYNNIAVVISTHRAGTMIGYCLAPIVIALNPEFRIGAGEPHRKFTICQFQAGHLDLGKIAADLSEIELGWGGSPTIIGSPQGTNSSLTIEQVLTIVRGGMI